MSLNLPYDDYTVQGYESEMFYRIDSKFEFTADDLLNRESVQSRLDDIFGLEGLSATPSQVDAMMSVRNDMIGEFTKVGIESYTFVGRGGSIQTRYTIPWLRGGYGLKTAIETYRQLLRP